MAEYEEKTGGRVLAIAHNGNLSNGLMWMPETMNGRPFTRAYVETRARRERIVDVTQTKAPSETHPVLSPDDEFAGFELWDRTNLSGNAATTKEMLPGS